MSKSTTIDPTPLKKAVEKFLANNAEITRTIERKKALDIEVEGYLASVDPDDEKAIHLISNRRVQAEVLPGFTQRARDKQPLLIAAVVEQIEAFERELRRVLGEDMAAFDAEWEPLFERHFPKLVNRLNGEVTNRAAGVVMGSALRPFLPGPYGSSQIGEQSMPVHGRGDSSDPEHAARYDASVIARAEELLTIAAAYQRYEKGTAKKVIASV